MRSGGRGRLESGNGSCRILLCVSTNRYDAMWTGHLKFKAGVVRYCVKASEGRSSKQCMIVGVEGSDVEEQVLASEIVGSTECYF